MIYLDNAATTPIDPEVLEVMIEYMKTQYGNPSSKYYPQAEDAKKALRKAREQVAGLLNCKAEEIIFNSGATEGNNFVIKGVADAYQNKGKHIITSKIEHKSVLNTCKYLEERGFEVTYLDVTNKGRVEFETLKAALREDTILVSIMWANNELGTLNDISTMAQYCNEKGVFFHTDATQVVGKIIVDLIEVPIDFLTFSGHKLHGPKGVGASFIRCDENCFKPKITPLIHGGDQEEGFRPGTHAMHDIVGLGKTCEIASFTNKQKINFLLQYEDILISKLSTAFPDIVINFDKNHHIPGIVNFSIPGTNNEFVVKLLSNSLGLSTGSACTIHDPSYVQLAIGNSSRNYYRISLSSSTTYDFFSISDIIIETISKCRI